jgi:hypothetical protein
MTTETKRFVQDHWRGWTRAARGDEPDEVRFPWNQGLVEPGPPTDDDAPPQPDNEETPCPS